MKLQDILNMEGTKIDFYSFSKHYTDGKFGEKPKYFDETDVPFDFSDPRIEVKEHLRITSDGYRGLSFCSISFDNEIVFMWEKHGRNFEEGFNTFLISTSKFIELKIYLDSLFVNPEYVFEDIEVSLDEELEFMDYVYGYDLTKCLNKTYDLKFEVGNIVEIDNTNNLIEVPFNSCQAVIIKVDNTSSCRTYFLKVLDYKQVTVFQKKGHLKHVLFPVEKEITLKDVMCPELFSIFDERDENFKKEFKEKWLKGKDCPTVVLSFDKEKYLTLKVD